MDSWKPEDAEARFGEVMHRALTAPQTILTPGQRVVVVMNEPDHFRLRLAWQRLLELDELPSEWLSDLWERDEPAEDAGYLSPEEEDELLEEMWDELFDTSHHCECCAEGRGPSPPPVTGEEIPEHSGKSTDFWTSEETEGRAAEVMHRALTNAPQTVIGPDLTAIVVLSEKEHQRLLLAAQRLLDIGEDLPVPRKLRPGEPSLWDLLQSLPPVDEDGEPLFPEGFFAQMREEERHCACCSQRDRQSHAAD